MTTTDEGKSLIHTNGGYGATTDGSKDIEAHHDLIESHCEGHPKGTSDIFKSHVWTVRSQD